MPPDHGSMGSYLSKLVSREKLFLKYKQNMRSSGNSEVLESSVEGLPVYLSGGVFSAPTMRERFERDVALSGYEVTVTAAPTDLFHGLFLIARERLEQRGPRAAPIRAVE